MTRSSVTTKCVKFHSRYLRPSQPAQTRAATAQTTSRNVRTPPDFMKTMNPPTTKSGMPDAMCLEKNHQCGRRSSAISSPSFSSFLGYGTAKCYARTYRGEPDRSGAHVADEE